MRLKVLLPILLFCASASAETTDNSRYYSADVSGSSNGWSVTLGWDAGQAMGPASSLFLAMSRFDPATLVQWQYVGRAAPPRWGVQFDPNLEDASLTTVVFLTGSSFNFATGERRSLDPISVMISINLDGFGEITESQNNCSFRSGWTFRTHQLSMGEQRAAALSSGSISVISGTAADGTTDFMSSFVLSSASIGQSRGVFSYPGSR